MAFFNLGVSIIKSFEHVNTHMYANQYTEHTAIGRCAESAKAQSILLIHNLNIENYFFHASNITQFSKTFFPIFKTSNIYRVFALVLFFLVVHTLVRFFFSFCNSSHKLFGGIIIYFYHT